MDRGSDSYRRFLEGDDSGFVEIVRDYKDGLILYLDGFVNDLSAAEDLAEDTFVRLGIRKPRFSERSSFKTWLYAVGRNLAVDALRKQARHGTVPADECAELTDGETLEAAFLREERKIAVHRTMKKLKPEYRQALWLVYFTGFSDREAAKVMKKSTHAMETTLYRARQALKTELLKEGYRNEDL